MIRRAKLKWNKIPKKKKSKVVEIVTHCDVCGKKLLTSHTRNRAGAVCSGMDFQPARMIDGSWVFYCSNECYEKHESQLFNTDVVRGGGNLNVVRVGYYKIH